MSIRLLWLAVLIVLASGWLTRHLGIWGELLGWASAMSGIVVALLVWLTPAERQIAIGNQAKWRHRIIGFVLGDRMLVSLSVIVLFTIAFVSSITVVMEGETRDRNYVLAAVDSTAKWEPQNAEHDASRRSYEFTTPFGRRFSTKMDGYQKHSFELLPWMGATIVPHDDLQPTPSILLRVPHEKRPILDVATMVIQVGSGCRETVELNGKGSILLGPPERSVQSRRAEWRSELTVFNLDATSKEKQLIAWRRPVTPDWAHRMELAGLRVSATLRDADNNVVAELEFFATTEVLQDRILESI